MSGEITALEIEYNPPDVSRCLYSTITFTNQNKGHRETQQ